MKGWVMKTKPYLTLEDVRAVIGAAEAEAKNNNWTVSIAVVDDGGHPLGMIRMDDAPPVSAYIAVEKARTSAMGKRESKSYEDMIKAGRTAFLSFPLQAMVEGGVPIQIEGRTVGAVGVSGVQSNEDAQIAKAGLDALV
jgi:glc operon protein GlcG